MYLVKSNQFQILRSYMFLLQLPILMCSCLVSMFSIYIPDIERWLMAYPSTILYYWCPCAGISIPDFVLYCFSGSPLASHAGSSTCTQRTGRRFVCQRDQEKWSPNLQSCVTARTGSPGVDTQVDSLHSNYDRLWEGLGNRRELVKVHKRSSIVHRLFVT